MGKPAEEPGEQVVHTTDPSYFLRMSEANKFQQEALVEMHQRGVERAGRVYTVTDGADWIQKFVYYHRPDAVRILDFAHAMEYGVQAGKATHEQGPASKLESPLVPTPGLPEQREEDQPKDQPKEQQELTASTEHPPSPEEVACLTGKNSCLSKNRTRTHFWVHYITFYKRQK